MGARRRAMQDVILDDARAPVPSPPPAARGARPSLVRRWWPAAAGLAVVVVSVGALSAGRSEAARLSALEAVPGILAPLDGPVSERWRAADLLWLGPTEVAGRLVGAESHLDGSVDVVALDPRTGRRAWRTRARGPGSVSGWIRCALPAAPRPAANTPAAPQVIVCVVTDAVIITAESTSGYIYSASRSRLVVVDGTTGAKVSDAITAASTSVTAFSTDLLISDVGADGRLHLARTDARGRSTRWSVTSPGPIPLNDSRQRAAAISVAGGLIVVDAGSTWVLSGGGALIETWAPGADTPIGARVEVLRGGLLGKPAASVDGVSMTDVVAPGSGRSFEAAGAPAEVALTDGSLADLVLLQSAEGRRLLAYGKDQGELRWTTPSDAGALVIVDGRVIRAAAGELESIDGRTGERVWTTPAARVRRGPLATDGRLVLLTRQDLGHGLVLAAYGLDDGRSRWQVDIDENLDLVTVAGRLYGWSGHALVALR